MTYCLGIRLNEGLVFAADSRTNAGVDNISKFRKLFVFENPGERIICVLTAGNLAITQAVISQLEEGLDGGTEDDTLYKVDSLSAAAKMVGDALRNVRARDEAYLKSEDADATSTFIIGGQIAGRRMRLFQVTAPATTSKRPKIHHICRSVSPSTGNRSWNVSSHRRWIFCKLLNARWYPSTQRSGPMLPSHHRSIC